MRRLAVLLAFVAALPALGQYGETVTVERILLDVRATNVDFEPITNLRPDEFVVTIGGKRAEVVSAEWIEDAPLPDMDASLEELVAGDTDTPPPPGRLIVLFIQTDFSRQSWRMEGQMKFLQYAQEILDMLTPQDRVAVFSFDSHLKFRLDFSSDRDEIESAMRESMLINTPNWPRLVHNPALGPRLDREEMKKAEDSERALVIVGNALRNIPGPKTMLLLGWGLGQRTAGGGVSMKRHYYISRRALEAARVTVFSLDTTYADYHDLEHGLIKAAADTGGFYAKTHIFPQVAIKRLHRTLTGHYELELRRPKGLPAGTHTVDVRVTRRGVPHVLAPGTWMDR